MKFSFVLSRDIRFSFYNGLVNHSGKSEMKKGFIMDATQVSRDAAVSLPEKKKRFNLKLPKKRKKWLKWLLIVLAAAVVIWWLLLRPRSNGALAGAIQYTPAVASIQDLTVSVGGSGTVTPLNPIRSAL